MIAIVKGPFDVELAPHGSATDATGFGRMSRDKAFHGDLTATSAAIVTGLTGTMSTDIQPGGTDVYTLADTLPPAGT